LANERGVVKGLIASVVQTRSIYTADVVPVGGDTAQLLWATYLVLLYSEIVNLTSNVWESSTYELQHLVGDQWVPYDEVAFSHVGTVSGEQIANAVALVLIGKCAGIRHFGRKFISPMGEQGVVGNVIHSSIAASAALSLTYYLSPVNGIGGGTLTPGVVTAAGVFHPFVGGVVSSILGSIRRRKPGRGI
jgi:hypothetical protein